MKMRHLYAGLVIAVGVVLAQAQDAQTYAEKLGWKQGDRVLILHIDDAGMSHDSNLGTYKAMTEGVANSVSVMMPCPWVPEFVKWLKEHPGMDAGLHLTLTSEWDLYRWGPLVGKPAAPGLVDEEGCLWGGVGDVVTHASPDEVEAEIRAQLDRARTMGFEPTHMDSHMGTLFATPAFMERYIKVGIESQIPIMFPGGHNQLLIEDLASEGNRESAEARAAQVREVGKQIWAGGLPVLDDLHNTSYGWKLEEKVDKYVEGIKSLKPGVTMMIMHCTDPTCIFDKISTSSDTRKGDLLAMLDPRVKQTLQDEGIILTTWRELKERRDAVK